MAKQRKKIGGASTVRDKMPKGFSVYLSPNIGDSFVKVKIG